MNITQEGEDQYLIRNDKNNKHPKHRCKNGGCEKCKCNTIESTEESC